MDNSIENRILDYSLNFLKEGIRNQADYFKHLTTLNTGSILIIIALLKGIFENPDCILFAAIAIVFFVLSLIGALYMIKAHNGYVDTFSSSLTKILTVTPETAAALQGDLEKQTGSISKSIKVFHPITDISFLLGIISFLVFALINLL